MFHVKDNIYVRLVDNDVGKWFKGMEYTGVVDLCLRDWLGGCVQEVSYVNYISRNDSGMSEGGWLEAE